MSCSSHCLDATTEETDYSHTFCYSEKTAYSFLCQNTGTGHIIFCRIYCL